MKLILGVLRAPTVSKLYMRASLLQRASCNDAKRLAEY